MKLLDMGFPVSIWTFVIGIILGLGITLITLGTISTFIFVVLIYSGVIKITPIIDLFHTILQHFFPSFEKESLESLKNSFQLRFQTDKTPRGIYCFHPHGSFSVSYFFHTMTKLTDFSSHVKGKATVAQSLYWLPWGSEILDSMRAIPNTYVKMKNVLDSKESLFVIPGGVKEMNIERKEKQIKIWLTKRSGIFRLALETGVPLIPVLSYGEEQLHELASFPGFDTLRKVCERIGLGLPIPSWKTLLTWFNATKGGIKNPVVTVVGEPIQLPGKTHTSEENIQKLRTHYIKGLESLFEKTKPSGYSLEIL